MPRRHRRQRHVVDEPRPLTVVGERTEQWRGEVFVVRGVTSHGAAKAYRCPGCDQLIAPGRPHVVVWPAGDQDAVDRRHWHAPCWSARDRRRPVR